MNGSGKTTFIKLLCRLYDPTEGVILLNGIDIRKYRYDEYMDIFSVVFQDFKLFSLPLGMIITFLRMSKSKVISSVTRFVVAVLRGTPLMLQLIAVTYGPYYLFGTAVSKNKLIPVVIAFAINYAAYFSEIYRGGIESIPAGQYEAANVLGYTKAQTFLRIILPQVVKRVMPSVTNEVVTLVKDTSMAFTVSYQEMFTIGKQIANSQTSFTPFLVAGVFYFVFNAIVDFVMGKIEKRMDYYK